jgi:hypothetical protein
MSHLQVLCGGGSLLAVARPDSVACYRLGHVKSPTDTVGCQYQFGSRVTFSEVGGREVQAHIITMSPFLLRTTKATRADAMQTQVVM